MLDCIARWFGSIREWLTPRSSGRRSRAYQAPAAPAGLATVTGSAVALPDTGSLLYRARERRRVVLDAADYDPVRPYLIAHGRNQEYRRQVQRRRALLLATLGIDVGPRVIHGVEVAR